MAELACARTEQNTSVNVVCSDILEFDGTYDIVVAFNLLPHFGKNAVENFFRHAFSLLPDSGALVFDYKDPRNNPDGLCDVWKKETSEFLITARFITVYEDDQTYYAVSYEFENRSTGNQYTTGELINIYFHQPNELKKKLRLAGFKSINVIQGIGDQSGIVEATR
jgi:hypothetical protein